MYLCMRLHSGSTCKGKVLLPDGCLGLVFAFKTKKQAREFMGKDCPLLKVTASKKEEK